MKFRYGDSRFMLHGPLTGSGDLKPLPPLPFEPLERIEPPTANEFIRTYFEPGRPVLLAGLARGWPACEKWSAAFFKERHRDVHVRVMKTREGRVRYEEKGLHYEHVLLGSFLDSLDKMSPEGHFLSTEIQNLPAGIRSDLMKLPYCAHPDWEKVKFWISPPGNVAPLHRDSPHNLYVQLAGKKQFVLFPPSDTRNLYPDWSRFRILSKADPEAADLDRFPRLMQAQGFRCVLEPGDVLFFPAWWWHQTRSLELSISVSNWWANGSFAWLIRMIDTAKRFLGLSR